MKDWLETETSEFIDDNETRFIRGPFEINNQSYEYKLIDKDGEDYCTVEQMLKWDVNMTAAGVDIKED